MCIISKKIDVLNIQEKRLAIRKKVQAQLTLSFLKNLTGVQKKIISQQMPQSRKSSCQTNCSSTQLPRSKRNSRPQKDNQFFEKYRLLEKIGEGGHSSVYKCQEKFSGKVTAVKITRFRDQQTIINSQRQFQSNKILSNCSIIKLQHLFVDNDKMTTYNVQEYYQFKNLKEVLADQPAGKFSQLQTLKVMKSLLLTIQFLHSKGICHRDIKPDNILYNPQTGEIKLIDLECSKKKKETEQKFEMWTKSGTLNYQAPQYFLDVTHSQKVDIWAAGVVTYELLTGKLPFQSPYHKKTIQLIISSQIELQGLDLCTDLEIMLKGLLEKQPNQRFTIEQSLSYCEKAIDSII